MASLPRPLDKPLAGEYPRCLIKNLPQRLRSLVAVGVVGGVENVPDYRDVSLDSGDVGDYSKIWL